MDAVLVFLRLLLAGVFAIAGIAKLADLPGSRKALSEFGVPATLSGPLGLLLPLAELVIAAALPFASTAWWGGLAALGLLLIFVIAIGLNLLRGRRPDCHCFGQINSSPAGAATLLRNGVLTFAACIVVWRGPNAEPSNGVAVESFSAGGNLSLAVGLALLAFATFGAGILLRKTSDGGRFHSRVKASKDLSGLHDSGSADSAIGAEFGLPVGAPAPEFSLPNLEGGTVTLASLRQVGKPVLLLFTNPDCGLCDELLPEVGRWQRERESKLNIVVVSRGDVDINRAKSSEHGLTQVLLQFGREIVDAYRSTGTPTAVLVNSDGTIASKLASTPDAVRALVRREVVRNRT